MYKWQQVKALKAQGVSIKKIARKLKLSKNTVGKSGTCRLASNISYAIELLTFRPASSYDCIVIS